MLEWYDFAVYAYVAGIIAKKFFPGQDEVAALLSAFLAYGLGFVARPLGGIIIGRLGDTQGRKSALLLTIFLMAGGTVMIGLLPTYEQIGFYAPLLLVTAPGSSLRTLADLLAGLLAARHVYNAAQVVPNAVPAADAMPSAPA